VQDADEGDTTTIYDTLPEAAEQLEAVAAVTDDSVAVIEEVVADKGYHSRTTVHDLETLAIRTYISEPDRGPQSWIDQEAERDAVYANRRRIRGDRGKRLLRRRGELLERPCAHLYRTGRAPASTCSRTRQCPQTIVGSCLQSRSLKRIDRFPVNTTRPAGTESILLSDDHSVTCTIQPHHRAGSRRRCAV
jgi:hypothetical protein